MHDPTLKAAETVIDLKLGRLVQPIGEPQYIFKRSQNAPRVLHPNWEWAVRDAVTGKEYKRTEYWLYPLRKVLSWRKTKAGHTLIEWGWTGNFSKLRQDTVEALPYFEAEIGDRNARFKNT